MSGDFGEVPSGMFNENIQLNKLANGVYYLQLVTASGYKTSKLTVIQ